MSDTKACNLTEFEIRHLIAWLGSGLYTHEEPDTKIERINYLNRCLKTFKGVEEKSPLAKAVEATPDMDAQFAADVKTVSNVAAGWGSTNNG